MRAAVIGTNWGRVHVAALREAGVEVVALVGDRAAEVRSVADELGVGTPTDPTALKDLDLDLISIATPAPTHTELITALPDVPVLCEKPAVGLSPVRALPPWRRSPVWVNHAFGFLQVARRAEAALAGLGPISGARVSTTFDLPGKPRDGREMVVELASHPWSWLVHLLGRPQLAAPAERVAHGVDLPILCGTTPVTVGCAYMAGLAGIRHRVILRGERGSLTLVGAFGLGQPWRFEAPVLVAAASADPVVLGQPEAGLPDPWYLANAHSIGAVVAAVRGGAAHPALVQWQAALQMDAVAQAGLGAGD